MVGFGQTKKKDFFLLSILFFILACSTLVDNLIFRLNKVQSTNRIQEAPNLYGSLWKRLFGCSDTRNDVETRSCIWKSLEQLLSEKNKTLIYETGNREGQYGIRFDLGRRVRELEGLLAWGVGKTSAISSGFTGGKCHRECSKYGNCNLETVQCECPFGFEGDYCEVDRLSHCRMSPRGPVTCGWVSLKSCECIEQCRQYLCPSLQHCHDHHYHLHDTKCFTRNNSILESGDGYLSPPDPKEAGVQYYRTNFTGKTPITSEEALTHEGFIETKTLDSCTDRCNFRGSCQFDKRNPNLGSHCSCYPGYFGASCQFSKPDACSPYGNCLDRGKCKDLWCHCEPPYWGVGCHIDPLSLERQKERTSPSHVQFKVYIYNLPTRIAYFGTKFAGYQGSDTIYTAYEYFLGNLLKSDFVTQNPEEANLFYVPAHTYEFTIGAMNIGNPEPGILHAIDYIRHEYPFWNNSGGIDHVFWTSGDRGACALRSNVTQTPIKLTHYGRFGRQEGGSSVCFRPGRDIVVPPHVQHDWNFASAMHGITEENVFESELWRRKKYNLFFAGGIRPNKDYSGNTRQIVFRESQKWNASSYVILDHGIPDYLERLKTSYFCLVAYGHGWAIRISLAMLSGCIPLIIQEGIVQPLADVLPYEEFSITLNNDDIPQIPNIIESLSQEELQFLQKGVVRYWHSFIHEKDLPDSAFTYTILSLQKRYLKIASKLMFPLPDEV